jgi:signal transduction histidine kinase
MSIRKRLILSNIAMILIPIFGFLLTNIILGLFFWNELNNLNTNEQVDLNGSVQSFLAIRVILMLVIIMITNGFLTFLVARSIIKPVNKLITAAKEISKGNLDFSIDTSNKDEIGELSRTFETMRQRLKESNELQKKYEENRKQLFANISHDLRTPITSIKGYVEGIRDGVANTPEKMERYLHTIYTKTKDLDALIEELFLYSKLDLNKIPFHFQKVNLYDFLKDFVEELQFDVEKDQIAINLDAVEKEYIVMADLDKLRRVVMNISQNAIKHLDKDNKKISFILTADDKQVTVQICDNGAGIPREDLPYIFDQFYRADVARSTKTGGSGLGLAIVKRIIEEHGGSIWATSELGKGTSIYFTLKKTI